MQSVRQQYFNLNLSVFVGLSNKQPSEMEMTTIIISRPCIISVFFFFKIKCHQMAAVRFSCLQVVKEEEAEVLGTLHIFSNKDLAFY